MPCRADETSPPPMLRPPVPTRFTAGRIPARASSTYCAAISTRVAVMRRSGLLAIASATSASSWESSNEASQLSATGPEGAVAGAAFHGRVRSVVASVPDSRRISARVGGSLVAQPADSAVPSSVATMARRERMSALVQFQDQPVELGAHADHDLADDVNH